QPVLVPFPTDPLLVEQGAEMPLDGVVSNLEAALSLGYRMLNSQPGRFILLSDGETLDPNRLEESLADVAAGGVPVHVVSNSTHFVTDPDLRLVNLSVPPLLREGETFDVAVTLHSPVAGPAQLTVTQDNALLAESDITLEPGLNIFSFEATASALGPHTFEAAVSSDPVDAQSINNRYSAFSQVFPPPQLLIVGDEPVVVSRFRRWLEEAGFVVERIRSDQIPSRLSELEPYAGMVLLDVSARDLQLEQMIAVQEYVRSLGRGLLVTGGRNSFSLGEYEGTPLEELLPLSLEPPPREERPPVALLLIIDHSGSMLEQEILSPTKLAMAKEAAIRATDILGPDDLIGVLIFDNQFEWVISFRPASDGAELLQIQSQIATIAGGGGTRILQALQVGLPDLMAQNTFRGPRHAVLFSDGKSFDGFSTSGPDPYDVVIDAAVEAGVTLSTIAIGGDSDTELLARLAERGRGRYHFASEPSELPELTISESYILRSSVVDDFGDYVPSVFAPHPLLRGLAGQSTLLPNEDRFELPMLSGYIGLTPKPQAEIALQVGPGDPLLGVWGYGLGRVAAWGSDIGTEWGREWLTWPDASRFWGQV
ncbi:MAG: VWA domain-containing protein, partial [Anaerolineae bacterium]|nr:VWA domain-containing protein [Anaerolineae bacterium]